MWPSLPASWFHSDAERRAAAAAMHAASEPMRRTVAADLAAGKKALEREAYVGIGEHGMLGLRVGFDGVIRARSSRYDVVLHYVPGRVDGKIAWRCQALSAVYAPPDCPAR